MKLKILFDKKTDNKNLYTGWGVSFLIDNKILFDTGENGRWLIENMETMGVDAGEIEAAVISHDHWDHTGGLWEVLAKNKGLIVYACPHFGSEFKEKVKKYKAELREADKPREIVGGVFIGGEITGSYHGLDLAEQALLLRTQNGVTVITGCAHPGIINILERAKEVFPDDPIFLVCGGFHLMEADKRTIETVVERFKEIKVRKAAPTHCSGELAEDIFKKSYGDNFIEIKVGKVLDV
jgi:7,8-dihydropterin-6-yl-methyl-4-(beta-D-ribofuranosyl)aminobenzene 5'-phosphate synthase